MLWRMLFVGTAQHTPGSTSNEHLFRRTGSRMHGYMHGYLHGYLHGYKCWWAAGGKWHTLDAGSELQTLPFSGH